MAQGVKVTIKDIQKISSELPASFGRIKNYEVTPLSENLVGFWGDHFILKVYNDRKEKQELFLKAVPRHIEKRMEIIQETGFFEREMKFYEHFVPKLLEMSSVCWAPKIYMAKQDHFIILENLNDFKTFPSEINVWDYNHFEVATRTLAVFHASSVIYEEKFGKLTQSKLKLLDEIAYPMKKDHIRFKGVENGIETLLTLIQLIPRYKNSLYFDDILIAFPDVVRKIFKFVVSSKKYRNVLLHGDIWVNNVMFRYDRNNDPKECKYIDFQFARYAPPAMDLATFFFASSTVEFRKTHLHNLLDIYCETFEKELLLNSISLSALSREEILKSFNEYCLAGLIESTIFNHQTLLPSNIATNMMTSSEEYEKFFCEGRIEKCIKAFKENSYYQNRMTDILVELIDDYILPTLRI